MSLQQMYRNMKLFNPNQDEVATIVVVQDVRGNVSMVVDLYIKKRYKMKMKNINSLNVNK